MIQGTAISMNGLLYTVKISPYFTFWYALPKCEIRWNKRSGGAIGIFDFPISLAKWMIVGAEIARMQTSFDETLDYYGESTEFIIRP